MKKGLVSIITPLYNSEKFIKETYMSIESQTYKNWEWIVIDDCSNDKGVEIVEGILKIDNRVKIIKNKKNIRAAESRNRGLSRAQGEFICFIDSDDLWEKNFLEEQIKFIDKKKGDIVFSSYDRVSEDLKKSFGIYEVPNKIELNDLLKTNYISCLTILYRSESLGEMRFISELKMHEDYIMWINFLEKSKVAYGNNKVLAKYRIRKNSTSRNKLKNLIYMYKALKFINQNKNTKIYLMLNYIYFGLKKNKTILLKNKGS